MTLPRPRPQWLPALALLAALGSALSADEPKLPAVVDKPAPEGIDDLKALQKQVRAVLDKVQPAVVGVRLGASQGSGVIITKDGYVLTAGHVSGEPNKNCTIILQDGKQLKAKTLGANRGIDSGLIKITDEADYPFIEMGKSADVKKGQWCIASGHPGGFKPGRTPVVRLGRILEHTDTLIRTDCTLVGGDSGGPLFDLTGKVIGIHSRISSSISFNIHVPVDTYRDTWERLAKAEVWGGSQGGPFIGVSPAADADDCKIGNVQANGPADKAGLKADDVILTFDGKKVATFDDLGALIRKKKPGDKVSLEVRRGDDTKTLEVVVGKRD